MRKTFTVSQCVGAADRLTHGSVHTDSGEVINALTRRIERDTRCQVSALDHLNNVLGEDGYVTYTRHSVTLARDGGVVGSAVVMIQA